MEKNNFRRSFGAGLTILGAAVLLFALVAFLSDGKPTLGLQVSGAKAFAPFVLGLIFFGSGISLINNS
ncbi:hypothetical protein ACAW74_00630 [Fibrella sp. WM1]|uniref:Uncharacterized protein n=1 Tax=Fibrella aestuarina BUZ 2 TaxID=1166018 RepID=I0KAL5_9BACT|nr:hypothetical protein [Fibrella aestuarina]CCH01168.1 hypothetical protein FAES_3159 [Fibrella aestuarina BUZ 2]